ncbi:MAG: (2Fe-2S)-binding protein [Xanthobacteraceae bacterium]|nr:(2Fe-2S)-binding protein [Xanthobacteraceae bacterium]
MPMTDPTVNRRRFLEVSAAAPLARLGMGRASAETSARSSSTAPDASAPPSTLPVSLVVNHQRRQLELDPRTTLLDALREKLGLVGAKKGCDHGQCGACTVHVGDRRVLSCLTLAASVTEPVSTIEGLASESGVLHPMQQAFIDHDGFQCGYCTPGQIMSAIACVREGHADDDDEIREYMSGNLCRCAAYPNIVAAIRQARSAGAFDQDRSKG